MELLQNIKLSSCQQYATQTTKNRLFLGIFVVEKFLNRIQNDQSGKKNSGATKAA